MQLKNMKEIIKNKFIPVSEKQFITELAKFPFLNNYKNWITKDRHKPNDNQFQIYIGDIKSDTILEFDALNLLVIGNIQAIWLNTGNNYKGYESGSLFVTGNIDCDYFSNSYGKLIIIGNSLHAKKILNNKFEDSTLKVQRNLTTAYFYGADMYAEVGENVQIEYGEGYCLPIGYKNAKKEYISPKHNEEESRRFLGLDEEDEELMEIRINEFIKQKIKN